MSETIGASGASWFNGNYEMRPWGMNGGLHTAYYTYLLLVLYRTQQRPVVVDDFLIKKCVDYTLFSDQTLSHDNMTGALTLSKLCGLGYEDKLVYRQWWQRLHPRDIFYYNYLRGGVWRLMVFPFVVIFLIDGLLALYDNSLAKNGIPNTTGKLLHWLRCHTMINTGSKLWLIWFQLLSLILKHKKQTWADIFKIYFTDRDTGAIDHPCIALSKSIYGN